MLHVTVLYQKKAPHANIGSLVPTRVFGRAVDNEHLFQGAGEHYKNSEAAREQAKFWRILRKREMRDNILF